MWLVGPTVYYTSFSNGTYRFMQEFSTNDITNPPVNKKLFNNFEDYHTTSSPKGAGRIMFDGIDFTNNTYTFGALAPTASDVKSLISASTVITGRVQTMNTYD